VIRSEGSELKGATTLAGDEFGLRAKAKGLLQGLEPEVHLVLDVMLPTACVVDALTAFRAAFPTVALRLHVEALGGDPWTFGWTQLLTIVGFAITISIAIGGFKSFGRWRRWKGDELRLLSKH
jgi:hypothetical protein